MPQPATSRLLLTELHNFVEQTVWGYPFPAVGTPSQDCRVFLHGLPEAQDAATWPFVICRWTDGEVTSAGDGKTVLTDTVALILGVHAPASQAQAGLLLAELLDLLRAALWRQRILAGRFELQEPVRARVADMERQVHKFHLATLETSWNYVWPPKAGAELTRDMNRGPRRPLANCATLAALRVMAARVTAVGSK